MYLKSEVPQPMQSSSSSSEEEEEDVQPQPMMEHALRIENPPASYVAQVGGCDCGWVCCRTHADVDKLVCLRARVRTRTLTRARTHTHTRARTHAHAHSHTHAHTLVHETVLHALVSLDGTVSLNRPKTLGGF